MKTNLFFILAFAIFLADTELQSQIIPTVIADGFINGVIGIDLDADGKLWVTEMGSGNDDGAIYIVDPATGSVTTFMTGLPAGVNPVSGEAGGAYRTYQLADNKVLIISGEGPHAMAEALLTVDKSGFTPGTPFTLANVESTIKIGDFVHAQGFLQSNPYNLAWDVDGNLYIADSGANSILKRDKNTGDFSIVTTLDGFPNPLPFGPPVVDPVPTKVLAKPGGGFYVSQLTGFPFLDYAANVYELDGQGNLSIYADSLTLVTDMQFDPTDGNLVVLQFGQFGPVDTTLDFIFGSASLIKLFPDGSRETLAEGFGPSPSFVFDANGDIYATSLFTGEVLKFDFPTATKESLSAVSSVGVFPNPFASQTSIRYDLKSQAEVSLEIYDLLGKRIKTLSKGKQAEGPHETIWDGVGDNGLTAIPGLYVYHLKVGNGALSGKIILLK